MTPERFCTLLDAYGTDFHRWPKAERGPARALIAQSMPELRQRLAEAALLVVWLDNYTVAMADDALTRRIVDSAGARKLTSAVPGWPQWQVHWLWPGASLAGVGLAGMLVGALAVSIALRGAAHPSAVDWSERGTAFSEPSPDWSEQ